MNRSPISRLILPLLAAGVLQGCGATIGDVPPKLGDAATPTQQFPMKVKAAPEELRLAAHATGLSPAQRQALADLAGRWTEGGGGRIVVQAPTKGVDQGASYATSAAAVSFLMSAGVPADRLQRVGYDPGPETPAPVIVGFSAYEAVIPACGREWNNLTSSKNNKPSPNFGCALSSNMAAQLANPGDVVEPRTMDAPDASRRAVIMQKYRQGSVTAGAQDSNASGSVSGSSGSGGSGGSGGTS